MAIPVFNYAAIKPMGAPGFRDLVSNIARGMEMGNLPQQIRLNNQAKKLANALLNQRFQNAPEQMALQKSLNDARVKMLGAQTGMLQQKTALDSIEAQKKALLQKLMKSAVGSQMPGAQPDAAMASPVSQLAQPPVQAAPPAPPEASIQSPGMVPPASQKAVLQQGAPGMELIDQLSRNPLLAQYMGMKPSYQVRQSPETGEVMTTERLPSGQITTQTRLVGRQPEDIEFSKKQADVRSNEIQTNLTENRNLQNINSNLDYIGSILKNSPSAPQDIGPYNSIYAYWGNNPQARNLLGQLSSQSGEIMVDTLRKLKGANTGRQMSIINQIKPNVKDPYATFVGKYYAMKTVMPMLIRRRDLYSQYLRQGMDPEKAQRLAAAQTDISKVEPKIRFYLKNGLKALRNTQIASANSKSKLDAFMRTHNLSPQQLQGMGG